MSRWMKFCALAMALGVTATASAQGPLGVTRQLTLDLQKPLSVTPGQRFYGEIWLKRKPAYQLARPFESHMPGSLGIPFHFAIDATVLELVGTSKDGHCGYFAPTNGQVRAWFPALGSVIDPDDFVGLRVCESRATHMDWIVNNSRWNSRRHHQDMETVWQRPVKRDDPEITNILSERTEPSGAPLRSLDYLGVRNGAAVVRYTEISPREPARSDEYSFLVSPEGVATGVILDAEFEIRPDPSQRAQITVTKPMGADVPLS
jgi:hypothetical protein